MTQSIYFVGVHSSNFSIVQTPHSIIPQAVVKYDLGEKIIERNGYFLSNTLLEDIRVVNYTETEEDDQTYILSYSIILLTDDTAIYELQCDFISNGDDKEKSLVNFMVLYAFQNYGSTTVWPRIESFDNWFSVAFFEQETQTFTYAVYYRRQNFAEERGIKLNQIIGGVDEVVNPGRTVFLKSEQDLGVNWYTNPTFFFYPDDDGNTRFFINRLDDGSSPCRTFNLNYQNITIVATESTFKD